MRSSKLNQQSKKKSVQPSHQLQTRLFSPTVSQKTAGVHAQKVTETSTNFNFGQANLLGEEKGASPSTHAVQPKLTIGQPGDKYEQEADNVAKVAVQRISSPDNAQRQEDIQRSPLSISRMMSSPLQRKGGASEGVASNEFERNLTHARNGGSSLDPMLQTKMESAIGADFSNVKIHTDTQANQLSQSIQAKAFTTGNDVFFKQGEYNPNSRSGQELIAHELTHVVQQGGAQQDIQRAPVGALDYSGQYVDAGGGTFVAPSPTDEDEVKELVEAIRAKMLEDKSYQRIVILTGCHGDSAGDLYQDNPSVENFYAEDLGREGAGPVPILAKDVKGKNIRMMDKDVSNDKIVTILAWCYSRASYNRWPDVEADWL